MDKLESAIQQEIVMYLTNTYCLKHNPNRCLIMAIPNGGKRDAREAKSLKNTGLLPGASDLVFIMPNRTIYFEVKTITGVQSDLQKDFEYRVENLGYEYYIVKSVDDVKKILNLKL